MKTIQRFFTITTTLLPPLFGYMRIHQHPQSPHYKEKLFAVRIAFQKLGSTFIKFGQLLSARPDLVGADLAAELRNLLDNEPIIPFSLIEKVVEDELQKPVTSVYKKIEHTPLATASIAQVHKATLHNGHIVAIKVQRPGIEKIIHEDLKVLAKVSHVLDFFIHIRSIQFSYLYKEFFEWITNELDFQVEGRRADIMRKNMQVLDHIIIPEIYWNHTTSKVLAMQYIDGITINDVLETMRQQKVKTIYDVKLAFPINPDLLIKYIISAIAKQALVDKFFHGDLHPANIILTRHNKVAFIDFGIVGTLNNEESSQVLLAILAIVESDPQSLVKVITSLIPQTLSQEELAKLHQEFADELHKLQEDLGGKVGLTHFISFFFSVSTHYPITWSSGFLLAIKTIAQIDTVAQLIGIKTPLVQLMKPEVEKAAMLSLGTTFSPHTMYKELVNLAEAEKKLPQMLSDIEGIIHSGELAKPSVPLQDRHTVRNSLILGSTLAISFPLVSTLHVSTELKPLLFIAIPLILFFILVKIFNIGKHST